MRRRQVLLRAIASALALLPCALQAQDELLQNPGLETTVEDSGPHTAPPFWKLEEGPLVPSLPASDPMLGENNPYLGDYNSGGVPVTPCPDTFCGAVDAADYVVWRDVLGQNVDFPNRHPDLVGSSVGENDYVIWRGRFGNPRTMDLAQPSNFGHLLFEGDWQVWFEPYNGTFAEEEENFAHLYQDVPGTPGLQYTMTGAALYEAHYAGGRANLNQEDTDDMPPDDGPPSPTRSYFALEFLNASGDVITPGSLQIDLTAAGQLTDTMWKEHTLQATAPAGTVNVRVRASMINGVLNPDVNPQSFLVDGFSLTAAAPALGAGIVPEPGTWMLVAVALVFLSASRHRLATYGTN
jgi:hypothetical protein